MLSAPTLIGGPQGSFTVGRCVTQMSLAPTPPPVRFEKKKRLSPSGESAGPESLTEELTTAPRLTGAVQSV